MTVPNPTPTAPPTDDRSSRLVRIAIWVAIGALIAAALVSVVWVLVGTQNGIVGRAFLTILLLAAFAGAAILDAHLAPNRPAWFALVSMAAWVLILLVGAVLIWMPDRSFMSYEPIGLTRFLSFLLVALIVQLAVLHVRLYTRAIFRAPTTFNLAAGYTTIALVTILTLLLIVPLTVREYFEFDDLYWRIVVAVSILAAVGTALVPLVNVLFAPKRPRTAGASGGQTWPTFVDGVTPLPVLPDGSPDWQAYYTGYPTGYVHPAAPLAAPAETPAPDAYAPAPAEAHAPAPAEAPAPAAPAPAQPPAGYSDVPPPPPLPPR
ncbi:hypothetical protein LQ938_12680 [Microbacterium sp. cx-55]|uniref:hypothetical protein n=1 Tax=Microbacterium sp. cx-55 TaxID=2875948 RepID=UPI001CC198B2|nr:hypothetical protein [Microbacterium sp. cx-55]MBZ4487878.1 hypothetical protein [Microbacterium sp. cx-55]UGB34711.1 hypothetical protein LQ938_12680 [Microbacterium sp. cx-55]